MLLPFLLGLLWRSQDEEIGKEGVRVSKGLRRSFVRLEDIGAVFTTMMPKGSDFHEVLAIEFATGTDGL